MRDRLLLPLFIPVGVAIVIGMLIYSVGTILLEIGSPWATYLAIGGATLILLVASVLAVGPRLRPELVSLATSLPVSAVIGIGLFMVARPGPSTGEETGVAVVTQANQIATDNAFSLTALRVPVNAPITLNFQNNGQALHNMHVLGVNSADGKEIKGELIGNGKSEVMTFTLATAGTWDFQCDVHPVEMKGKVTAVEGAVAGSAEAAGAIGTGGSGGTAMIATDNKFDKSQLTISSTQDVTIAFQNKGSALHNWHVLNVQDAAGKDIKTQLIGGGKTENITFRLDKPGTYDYTCDVHPVEMRGKLTVQ